MRTAVLVPCYKRPEYTKLCIEALQASEVYRNVDFFLVDDGSNDGTASILESASLPGTVKINKESKGLRNVVIDFFEAVRGKSYDFFAKMDNDCLVPEKWLSQLTNILASTDYDIISPNVLPSNAAYGVGKNSDGDVRPSDYVGGLWCMKANLIEGVNFERFNPNGISGAFNILKQIIAEKDAKCGWVTTVTVQDVGHWSGSHPLHIKSREHEQYSAEVRRDVSWSAA